ncbi:MAG TPA: APC family permease [Thermoanaerobaculia bacterium]|jgi:APA family basic amino acid/polyamine antiporter|nr:APC family permease [Thermoanaerobaculia bacterium]
MQDSKSGATPGVRAGARSPIGHLRRLLGLAFGLAVIVGSTIGVGILRTPGLVAGHLHSGSAILIAWTVGGVYTVLGAVCLAELGTMMPQAGGYYVYARRGFGNWVGFSVGWTDWLTYCTVLAYVSIGLAEFSGVLLPVLAGWVRPVAIVTLLAMVALQWAGLKVSAWFQEWTTAVKFLAFLALIVAALTMGPQAARNLGTSGDAHGLTFSGIILALQAVVIAYGGWQSALYFTEEDRDPSRNLPRAMIGGVLSVIVVYLLVNLALLAVLPISDLAKSTLPGADAAAIVAGDRGKQILTVLSVISLLPLLNAILMIGTRVLFAMGRDGLVSRRTASVNAGGTPDIATVVTTAVAVLLIASGTFQTLIALASVFLAANYCVCCLALVVLRRHEPSATRPFRAWGYPWSAGIVVVGAIVFLAGVLVNDTGSAVKAIGLLAIGLVGRVLLSGRAEKTE